MRCGAVSLWLLLAAAAGEDLRPLPLRNRIPAEAKLVLRWSADLDGAEDLHIRGRKLEVKHRKLGRPRDVEAKFFARLPRRELGVFARLVQGRGRALVLQDPARANGYEAIVRVADRGKGRAPAVVEIYCAPRPAPPPPFPVSLPDGPAPAWRRRALQDGRFWGERDGPVSKLAQGRPLFTWVGEVTDYAVLAISATGLELVDCGLPGAQTTRRAWSGTLADDCVVLSRCDGPGRVRVVQRMRVPDEHRVLIEIDDRDVEGTSGYRLVGHAVTQDALDALYGTPDAKAAREAEAAGRLDEAATRWLGIATSTRAKDARLWAIEKLCMLRAYPGPEPNALERMTLAGLSQQEQVQGLRGNNVILAWPAAFLARVPARWRFLAEMDATLDWLRVWTGKDQVAGRRKRLISRFRVDQGGTALYVDFRLHIPRKQMQVPPHHGPYSHEASHGYMTFSAICPTGRYNEGLTEVSRTAYWWFLGIDDAWRPFQDGCLRSLKKHYDYAGTLEDVPSYGAAAGVYLTLLRRFCCGPEGDPDWVRFTPLFCNAVARRPPRGLEPEARFALFADVCQQTFGAEGRRVLEVLRLRSE
ncbi:MAG: hypothetical protein ACYTED_16805 [Planctomycetota bacterium]